MSYARGFLFLTAFYAAFFLAGCAGERNAERTDRVTRLRDLAAPPGLEPFAVPSGVNIEVTIVEIPRHGYAQRVAMIMGEDSRTAPLQPDDFAANGFVATFIPERRTAELAGVLVSVGGQIRSRTLATILSEESYDFPVGSLRGPSEATYYDWGRSSQLELATGRLAMSISARQFRDRRTVFEVTAIPTWKRPYDDPLLFRAGLPTGDVRMAAASIRTDMQRGDMLMIAPGPQAGGAIAELFLMPEGETVLAILLTCMGRH